MQNTVCARIGMQLVSWATKTKEQTLGPQRVADLHVTGCVLWGMLQGLKSWKHRKCEDSLAHEKRSFHFVAFEQHAFWLIACEEKYMKCWAVTKVDVPHQLAYDLHYWWSGCYIIKAMRSAAVFQPVRRRRTDTSQRSIFTSVSLLCQDHYCNYWCCLASCYQQ